MNRIKVVIVLMLMCFVLSGCTKYKHSSQVTVISKDDTQKLTPEEAAAIKEEDEFMDKIESNIEIDSVCVNFEDNGFEKEVTQQGMVIYFIGSTNNVSAHIASENKKNCSAIVVEVDVEKIGDADTKDELKAALKACMASVDSNYDEQYVDEIIEGLKTGEDKNQIKLSDNLQYSTVIQTEDGEKSLIEFNRLK